MTFAVAYDVPTSYSDAQLQFRRCSSDDGVARAFATAERGWFGDILFDGAEVGELLPPALDPGYALILDRAERGRPHEHPRTAQLVIHEYFDPAALLEDAKRHAASNAWAAVVGIRVTQRKPAADPAWDAETRAVFRESVAHPADDDPRLVFADALGTRRGGFVIIQCDLARGGMTPAESRARRRAQRDLLAKRGTAWSRLDGLAKRCVFRRGFVDAAEIDLEVLGNDHARVFDAAPHLASVVIDTPTPSRARLASTSGWWRRLRGVSIDARALPLELDGALAHLRALELRHASPIQTRAAIEAGGVRDLEVLGLASNQLDADAIGALLATSPRLRALDVSGTPRALPAQPPAQPLAIPDTVRELYATAGTTTIPRGIEKLALYGVTNPRGLDELPALRSLDLLGAFIRDDLGALSLPALRELRLHNASVDRALSIARAFGAQLELLDLRGIAGVDEVQDELREAVAGDLWLGKPDMRSPLLNTSYLPDEPMWDVGTVELG